MPAIFLPFFLSFCMVQVYILIVHNLFPMCTEVFMEITLTKDNFKGEVLDSQLPVLVDFWATWCGPCQMMGPVVAEIAEEKDGTLKVGKVNVDEQEDLAQQFNVMSIPTFILFKGGKAVAQVVGGRSKEDLLASLGI